MAEWPQYCNSSKQSLQDIASDLSGLIQRAALLYEYVEHRWNTGCGDQGHEDSVKEANKALTRVRKALGFTYPERHITLS